MNFCLITVLIDHFLYEGTVIIIIFTIKKEFFDYFLNILN